MTTGAIILKHIKVEERTLWENEGSKIDDHIKPRKTT